MLRYNFFWCRKVIIYMIAPPKFMFAPLLLLLVHVSFTQELYEDQTCISEKEFRLYEMVNAYRAKHNQPAIPLSASLSFVAGVHVWDLQHNQPDEGECNLHSWSDYGSWTPCCYTEDHEQAKHIWSKPNELTTYDGYGYEIAYYSSWSIEEHFDMPAAAMEGWKSSPGHKQVMINQYAWKRMKWNSMGVGIFGNYAVVWFGEEEDSNGVPEECPE